MEVPARPTGAMSLTQRTGLLAAGNLAYRLGQTFTLIVVVRLISPDAVGTYRQVWAIHNSLFVLFLLGLPGSVYHYLASAEPSRHRHLLRQTVILLALFGVGFAGVLMASALFIPDRMHNPLLRGCLLAFAPFGLFSVAFAYDYPVLVVYRRARTAAALMILYSLAQMAATLLVLSLGFDVAWAFLAMGGVAAARYLLTAVIVWRMVPPGDDQWDEKGVRRQLRYSIPLCLADAVSASQAQLDKIVAALCYAPATFAKYSVGAAQLPFVTVVRSAVFAVLLSEISALRAAGDTARILGIWRAAVRKTALVFHPLLAFCLVVSDPLISVLYTSEFREAAVPFRIYLSLLVLMVFPAGSVLLGLGLSWYNMRVSLAGAAATALLAALTARALGFTGPALAVVIAQTCVVALQVRRVARELDVSASDLLVLRTQAGVALRAFASALPCFLLARLDLGGPTILALCAVCYGTCYLLLVTYTGVLTHGEREQLRRLLRYPLGRH